MANKYPDAYCINGSNVVREIRFAVIDRIDSLRNDMVDSVKNDRFYLLDSQRESIMALKAFIKELDERIEFDPSDDEACF